jgi:hypothetical protein
MDKRDSIADKNGIEEILLPELMRMSRFAQFTQAASSRSGGDEGDNIRNNITLN